MINSVVEFVMMALKGNGIFSDLLDKAVDHWDIFLTRSIYIQLSPL